MKASLEKECKILVVKCGGLEIVVHMESNKIINK